MFGSHPRLVGWSGVLALLLAWAPAAGSAETPSGYRIQAGDVLRVDVGTRTDLSGTYTVSASGAISMPVVGEVKAAGRAPGDLADDLSRRFSLVDRDIPRVAVTVVQSAGRQILVLGAVLLPGSYDFHQGSNPWDAIAQAGGAADDAVLSEVELIPGDATPERTTKVIDVASAVRTGTLDRLDKLRPGDTVRVPHAAASGGGTSNLVFVFGAVGSQGAHPVEQTPDLLTAVIASGGPAGDADLSKVEIVRKSGARVQHIVVDLRGYLGKGNTQGNLPLQAGDTIYVQRAQGRAASFFSVLNMITPLLALATSVYALTRR